MGREGGEEGMESSTGLGLERPKDLHHIVSGEMWIISLAMISSFTIQ
jgi:hypothetical protein